MGSQTLGSLKKDIGFPRHWVPQTLGSQTLGSQRHWVPLTNNSNTVNSFAISQNIVVLVAAAGGAAV